MKVGMIHESDRVMREQKELGGQILIREIIFQFCTYLKKGKYKCMLHSGYHLMNAKTDFAFLSSFNYR